MLQFLNDMATWLQKLGKWIGSAFESTVNSKTQAGLTGAQRDQNAFNSREAEANRDFQSAEAAAQRDWSSQEAERARDWQEEMYDKYNSLSGKISQAEQAGVNPMFAVTGNAVTPMSASSSAPGGASAPGSQASAGLGSSPTEGLMSLMSGLMGLKKIQAEIRNIDADTRQTDKNTSWIDSLNTISISKLQSDMEKNSSEVALNLQNVRESISRVSVNDSVIELNGAKVELVGNESALTATKNALENLNVKEMEMLMPYIEARQEASIALMNAQTEEAKYHAEKLMYDANVSMLRGMVDAKLIDSEYYDNIIMQSKYDAKGSKRSYHWKPINDVCSNISKIAVGIGSAVSAASGAGFLKAAGSYAGSYAVSSAF